MKKWTAAAIEELKIGETAHGWTGLWRDGGRLGDGQIAGHLTWDKPEEGGNSGNDNDNDNDNGNSDTDLNS